MLFVVHCLDKPGALDTRLANHADHRAYLETAPVTIVMSGPLVEDDGETMKGSFFLVDAPNRDAVATFNGNDPFFKAGIWASINIDAFQKRVG